MIVDNKFIKAQRTKGGFGEIKYEMNSDHHSIIVSLLLKIESLQKTTINQDAVNDLMKDLDQSKVSKPAKTSKYMKTFTERSTGKTIRCDVYDTIVAFGVFCPAQAHALKKGLCAGERGVKTFDTDIREAIDSLEISLGLNKE